MLILLALPVLVAVTAMHRFLALYAPSNLLVRYVRSTPRRWRDVMLLVALAASLTTVVHGVAEAVAAGAPEWLNGVGLILAWDAIKFELLGLQMVGGALRAQLGRLGRCIRGIA